jgi:hypothetical protein
VDRPANPLFDFVTSRDFRASLESDYAELTSNIEARNWKSAQVMAGSIIEAILIDYLVSSQRPNETEEALLKLDLGKAIPLCQERGILSAETALPTQVIREYRNLIHPGRVVRLAKPPTEEGAKIALQLVAMVAKDVAKKKAEVYGLTAEQVVAKIEGDPTTVRSVVPSLLQRLNHTEQERLMLELLPERNLRLQGIQETEEVCAGLTECFRLMMEQYAPYPLRQKAVIHYASILRDGHGAYREAYEGAFFVAGDMQYLEYGSAEMNLIKSHVYDRLRTVGVQAMALAEGIGRVLSTVEIEDGTADAIWHWILRCPKQYEMTAIAWLQREHFSMSPEANQLFHKHVGDTITDRGLTFTTRARALAEGLGIILRPEAPPDTDDIPF